MGDSKTRLPWLRPFTIALLILVAPAVVYWFVYAERRIDTWERQAWPVLEGIARELQAEVDVESERAAARAGAPSAIRSEVARAFVVTPASGAGLVSLESRGDFDGIVVLDGNGAVLRQSGKLPRLAGVGVVEFEGADGERLHIVDRKLRPLAPGGDGAPVVETHQPSATVAGLLGLDRHPRLRIGADSFAAFLMPAQIEVPENVAEPGKQKLDYVIVGLVEGTRLQKHSLRLAPIALIWIAALVTGAFLVLPFVKIRFMGRRERLKVSDMWMLAGSAFLGTGILTLLVLQLDAYSRLLHTLDADLLRVTKQARANVDAELDAAFAQLKLSAPQLAEESLGEIRSDILASESFPLYPHFAALFLTDRTRQTAKWIPGPEPTPLVLLDDQPWFKPALELSGPARFSVVLTVARRTTGLDLAVIAVPVRIEGAKLSAMGVELPQAQRTGIAAIATQLISIRDAVLPAGFQFAVVRPGGIVALRSFGAPHGGASFYTEAPEMADLVKAAASERSDAVVPEPADRRYGGRMQRVTAAPLWADARGQAPVLVAFYDKAPVEAFAAQLVVNASCWLVLLVAACLAAAAAARLRDPHALDLAWPARERGPLYGVALAAFAAFTALMLMGQRLPEWALPYFVLGAPALGLFVLALAAARLGPPPRGGKVPEPPLYPSSYVLFVIAGLIAFVAVPVFVVFRDSAAGHRAALEESIRSNQRAAKRFVPEATRESNLTSYPFDEVPLERKALAPSAPESWCRGLFLADPQRLPQRHFSFALDACIPASLREPMLTASALAVVDANDVAPRPDQGVSSTRWLFIALQVMAALALFWWFVREVGTKILGLRLEGDGVVDGSRQILGGLPARAILLRPPVAMLQAVELVITQQQGTVIDLRDEQDVAVLDPLSKSRNLAGLVSGLEWRLHDPTWRKALLVLLEAERTAPVVLVAAVDPLYFLEHRGRELDDAAKVSENEIERWSRALDDACKVRFAPLEHPFAAPPANADPHFAEWVRAECRWDECLAAIGDALLARTDLDEFNHDDVIEYVQDQAEAHYRALWSLCCVGERLVLVQLAEEGLVNPRCFDLLRRLRRRRLVRVDPRFRLMNESFRRFALETEERSTVLGWEREGAAESSARVRGPLLALAFVAAAILLLTQGREIASLLGYASATGSFIALVVSAVARARATVA